MTRLRMTSITAGLLLSFTAVTVAGCSKKEKENKSDKKTAKKSDDKKKPDDKTKPDDNKKPDDKAKPDDKKKVTMGDGYVVKLERPVKVGYKFRFTKSHTEKRKVTIGGRPGPGSGEMSFDYEAEVVVKKVDDKGDATVEEHKVAKFEAGKGGMKKPVLKKDQVVVATLEGKKTTFTVDGKAADPMTAKLLAKVIDLHEDMDADEVFSGKDKHKVGDSWDVNKKLLADSFNAKMKGSSLPAKAENISGTVKLVAAGEKYRVKALNVAVEFTLKKAGPKMGPVKLTDGTIKVTLDGWVPQDPASMAGDIKNSKTVMHFEGELGGNKLIADVEQTNRETQQAIK